MAVIEQWSEDERQARDLAYIRRTEPKATGRTAREGEIWNQAWAAAREYYAPNADEAEALRTRLGLDAS